MRVRGWVQDGTQLRDASGDGDGSSADSQGGVFRARAFPRHPREHVPQAGACLLLFSLSRLGRTREIPIVVPNLCQPLQHAEDSVDKSRNRWCLENDRLYANCSFWYETLTSWQQSSWERPSWGKFVRSVTHAHDNQMILTYPSQ